MIDETLPERYGIEASGTESAQQIAVGVLQVLQQFIGDAQPFDDMTLLVAKRE